MEPVEILAGALKLEQEGQSFYQTLASQIHDPELIETFKLLAVDEVAHAGYIQRQLQALQGGAGWSSIPELAAVEALDSGDPLFPQGKAAVEALPATPNEEDGLLFALGIENKSYNLYRGYAQSLEDSAARQLFMQLAAAEMSHFNVLMARYESRFGYPR